MRFSPMEVAAQLNERKVGIWRISLEQIEATAADHLGRGRVRGNQAAPCFSRQVSMYLAKNVGVGARLGPAGFTMAAIIQPFFTRLRRSTAFGTGVSLSRVDRGADSIALRTIAAIYASGTGNDSTPAPSTSIRGIGISAVPETKKPPDCLTRDSNASSGFRFRLYRSQCAPIRSLRRGFTRQAVFMRRSD
jgi:hypothetical protein